MANEITLTASLSINKPSVMSGAIGMTVTSLLRTMTGNFIQQGVMNVPTINTAMPLGNVTSPYYLIAFNTDASNYVTGSNGASGAVFPRMKAGDWMIVPLDPGSVPYFQANTAAVLLEYLLASQ